MTVEVVFGYEADTEEAKTTAEVVSGHGLNDVDERSATIMGYEHTWQS